MSEARKAGRILFAMGSPAYLRYFDETVRLLARRGHAVSLAFDKQNPRKTERSEAFVEAIEGVVSRGVIPRRSDPWESVARGLRGTIDFVRFLDPRYGAANFLRGRMVRKGLPPILRPLGRLRTLPASRVRAWIRRLTGLEAAIPPCPRLLAFLEAEQPDLVVVSPLVDAASNQVDLIKAARRLRIPTALCVASWDNLTNKGLMRIQPDRVMVWNAIQAGEAESFHGTARSRIVMTGAQPFDRWFDRRPARGRAEFCRQVGLPSDRPYVLFVGSSSRISAPQEEVLFVRRWIAALRASPDPAVRSLAVLVRPHPYNFHQWEAADLSGLGETVVWPRGGANPIAEEDRAGYFDSMHHGGAVVGINTSAMVEATIVGRPVFSIRAPEFREAQEGTLHFQYLLPEHGGFLRVARTLEEHVAQLSQALAPGSGVQEELRRFVGSFVRPFGLEHPSTPRLADAIEATIEVLPEQEARAPLHLRVAATLLAAAVACRTGGARGRIFPRPQPEPAAWKVRALEPTGQQR